LFIEFPHTGGLTLSFVSIFGLVLTINGPDIRSMTCCLNWTTWKNHICYAIKIYAANVVF